jgi:hypothetical protein
MRTKKPPSPMWVFQLRLRYLQKIFIPANLLGEVQANELALANLICDCHVFKPFPRLKELFCKCFIWTSEQASVPGTPTQCDPPKKAQSSTLKLSWKAEWDVESAIGGMLGFSL